MNNRSFYWFALNWVAASGAARDWRHFARRQLSSIFDPFQRWLHRSGLWIIPVKVDEWLAPGVALRRRHCVGSFAHAPTISDRSRTITSTSFFFPTRIFHFGFFINRLYCEILLPWWSSLGLYCRHSVRNSPMRDLQKKSKKVRH